MSFVCSVFGLGIHVDLPIAGLIVRQADCVEDVRISLGAMPPTLASISPGEWREYYVGSDLEESGEPGVKVWRLSSGSNFRINYLDGTVFVVNAQGNQIWATWPKTATLEDTATYLLGPILGFVLRLRGITCLHASAVAIANRAIALVGPSGRGKSTMAAAFARQGYAVLSDDVLALSDQGGEFLAQPAYPRVRLWPQAVKGLFGSEDALPRITPNWDKCFLDLNGRQFHFQHEPLPIAAIYFLNERGDNPALPCIEAVGAHEGMMSLVANTYTNYLLDRPMRAREFDFLGRLVKSVPLRRVSPSMDIGKLPDLCKLIAADFLEISSLHAAIS